MPALENSGQHADWEESSQDSDQGDIPKGPTFHLNSKRLNVACIKRIAEALGVLTEACGTKFNRCSMKS